MAWGKIIVGVTLLAGGLRIFLLSYAGSVHPDSITYLEIASRYAAGGSSFDPIFPPMFPIATAWLIPLTGDPELAARWLSILCGTLLIIPAMDLVLRLSDRKTATIAGLLLAFHPLLSQYSTYVLSESLFAFLLLCGIWITWKCLTHGGWPWFLAAGLAYGVAALARPEAAAFLGLLVLVGLHRVYRAGAPLARTAYAFAGAIAVFLVCCYPYASYIHDTTGQWSLSGKTGIMLAKARTVGEANVDRAVASQQQSTDRPQSPVSEWLGDPIGTAKRVVMNIHLAEKYAIAGLFSPLLFGCILIGLIQSGWRQPENLFAVSCLLPYLPVFLFIVEPRIFLPLVPLGLMFASRGIQGVTRAVPISSGWVTALVLLTLLPYTFRPVYRAGENDLFMDAGRWLKTNNNEQPSIAFVRPVVAYYAEGTPLQIPTGEVDDVVNALRTLNATHLVVDSRLIPVDRPNLIGLLHPVQTEDLDPIYHRVDEAGQRVVIYAIGQGGS